MNDSTPLTIKDIAKMAQVSPSTVSRFLNSSGYVGKDASIRIEKVIQATGFIPNSAARSLVINKTNMIGVIVPTLDNSVYIDFLKGVSDKAEEHGYSVVIGKRGGSLKQVQESMMHLASLKVDGIVMTTSEQFLIDDDEFILPFIKQHIPIVQLGKGYDFIEADSVSENAIDAGMQVGSHLARMGHEKVAVIGSMVHPFVRERVSGFKKAYLDMGITSSDIRQFDADYTRSGGFMAMKKILTDDSFKPTAVFGLNDVMAIGALLAAEEMKVVVPEEISIIGIDGIELGNMVRPRLSTLVLPIYELGSELYSLLHSRMKGEYTGPARHKVYTGRLAIRESSYYSKLM
jgi:DNA-binding LacI/PurR family transcriptional regulator